MSRNPLLDPDPEPAWMKGPKITSEDLKYGSDRIQIVTAAEWWSGSKSKSGTSSAKPAANPNVMAFGKYRGRLIVDVMEEDPGYIDWACREIAGFEKKVEALS